ncbi:MAG: S8 family serine peptidase [Acidobacteria bacterium]|nr:S8 family serine peptidase [Acidobacteriota bacterium]
MFDERHTHTHRENRFAVIPTEEKLGASPRFAGRGVTIAFLDSGFYPHPDFAERVIAFHDVAGEEQTPADTGPRPIHWHGTQTVTACAGGGQLSDGIYKGLASAAKLVLIKVSRNGRIGDDEIKAGLKWVIANREKFDIRIVNMSLGGDMDESTHESRINRLAEKLVEKGVIVTVAAGNAGETHSIPPANAPSVITVGGYTDANKFDSKSFRLYHSNFGETIDGIVKPEIIAPAMFVAAPILPETEEYKAAEALSLLADTPDYAFSTMLDEHFRASGLSNAAFALDTAAIRNLVEQGLKERKIVATHYQHVDGTSFAAPIAASVAAQMMEANPKLSPMAVKHILISTAHRLNGFSAIRQGFGVLNAAEAVSQALRESHALGHNELSPPRATTGGIAFFHHDDEARTVSVAGDFNNWDRFRDQFKKCSDGVWRIEIPALESGEYLYKLVIDGEVWKEDPNNMMKREDGFGGFNSLLRLL